MTEILKALSDESRLRIMNMLLKEELCVCELEYLLKIPQTNVSRHLSVLKHSGIVEQHKTAQWVHHSISETFLKENADLVGYLQRQMSAMKPCVEDTASYMRYKESGVSREQVRKLMQNE